MKKAIIQNVEGPQHPLVMRAYYPNVDGMHVGYAVSRRLIAVLCINIVALFISLGLFLWGHMTLGIGSVLLIPTLVLSSLTYHYIKTAGKKLSPALIACDVVFLSTVIPLIISGKVAIMDIVLLVLILMPLSMIYHEIKTYAGYYEVDKHGRPMRFLSSTFFMDQRPMSRKRFLQIIQ